MSLSFENASTESKGSVIKPGVHEVVTEGISSGSIESTGSKFINWKVVDKGGSVLEHRYFLNTDVKPGNKQSAWNISSSSILQIVMASNGLSEEVAKSKLTGVNTPEELATKLSTLTVGKSFRLKVNGKEVDGSKGRFVKSEFGNYQFAESTTVKPEYSTLKFNPETNIKRLPAVQGTSTETTSGSGLPW